MYFTIITLLFHMSHNNIRSCHSFSWNPTRDIALEPNSLRKVLIDSIWAKRVKKKELKLCFLQFSKIFVFRFFWNWSKMKNRGTNDISAETLHLTKFFWVLGPQCSWQIRLQDSLNCNILWMKCKIKLIFC